MHVEWKGKRERTVFLSADARWALADYLETGHPVVAVNGSEVLISAIDVFRSEKTDACLQERSSCCSPGR
jgi:site-specific recombinase XerD